RIGMVSPNTERDPIGRSNLAVLYEALRKLGWVDGRNIRIDVRWGEGDGARIRQQVMELVATAPEMIVAIGTPAAVALKQMTSTIPVVFVNVPDPIANGLVASIARPGGNITGFASYEQSIAAKQLELLKQIAPRVTRVAFMYDPANSNWSGFLAELRAAVPSLGVQVLEAPVREADDIERRIDALASEPDGGLLVKSSPIPNRERARVIARAADRKLPSVFEIRDNVAQGGLASYGVELVELYRGAAGYVDRILKGDRPGDLPVQFSTKIELVINTKTAKALGLEAPLA